MSARLLDFTVPADDVAWCAALAEALSVCCASPSARRVREVRALVSKLPVQMLPAVWHDLLRLARGWLETVRDDAAAPRFEGKRAIETALRDKPLSVPSWAERYS